MVSIQSKDGTEESQDVQATVKEVFQRSLSDWITDV